MRKFGIRIFTLTICGAALLTVPVAAPAKADTKGGREAEIAKKKQPQASGSGDLRSSTPGTWPPPMYDDFDRKNAGGGGGM
jgi:hypothetical protein